jgi:heme O synthase-like polyprenyltransferase
MTDDVQTLLRIAEILVCVLLLVVIKIRVRKTKRNGLRDLFGRSGITLTIVFLLIQATKVVVWSQA